MTPSEDVQDTVASEVEEEGTSGQPVPNVPGIDGQEESAKEVQK